MSGSDRLGGSPWKLLFINRYNIWNYDYMVIIYARLWANTQEGLLKLSSVSASQLLLYTNATQDSDNGAESRWFWNNTEPVLREDCGKRPRGIPRSHSRVCRLRGRLFEKPLVSLHVSSNGNGFQFVILWGLSPAQIYPKRMSLVSQVCARPDSWPLGAHTPSSL